MRGFAMIDKLKKGDSSEFLDKDDAQIRLEKSA
jgi:hypothetical protein